MTAKRRPAVRKEPIPRDKYWGDNPNNDTDFYEISVANEDVEKTVAKYAPRKLLMTTEEEAKMNERSRKRQERLVRKIFKAASEILSKGQWEMFSMRWVAGLKEVIIAERLGVNQSYVSNTLKTVNKKIRARLRLAIPLKTEIPLELETK